MRKFIYLIRRFFYRIRMNWAYIKYFVFKDNSDGYIESLQEFLFYQLTHISKQLIKTKGVEDKKRLLNFLWECRKAYEKYTNDAAMDTALEIDSNEFKRRFHMDFPDVESFTDEDNMLNIVYSYPSTLDVETTTKIDTWLKSEERAKAIFDNYKSLHSAYYQDFINKLGKVLENVWF